MTRRVFANAEYAQKKVEAMQTNANAGKHLHVLVETSDAGQEDHNEIHRYALYDAEQGIIFARFDNEAEKDKAIQFNKHVFTPGEGVNLVWYWGCGCVHDFPRLNLADEGWVSEQFATEQSEGPPPTELPNWRCMFQQDDGSWVTCYDSESEPGNPWPELARLPRMNTNVLPSDKKKEVAAFVVAKLAEELRTLSLFEPCLGYRMNLLALYRLYQGVQTLSLPAWVPFLGPAEADRVRELKSTAESRVQQACWGAAAITRKEVSVDELFSGLELTGAEFVDWSPEWANITALFTERELICAILYEKGRTLQDEYSIRTPTKKR